MREMEHELRRLAQELAARGDAFTEEDQPERRSIRRPRRSTARPIRSLARRSREARAVRRLPAPSARRSPCCPSRALSARRRRRLHRGRHRLRDHRRPGRRSRPARGLRARVLPLPRLGRRPGPDGADLRVRYVLTGNLRRAGDRIRVLAALADAETGAQIWSKAFDRKMTDLFAMQEEIAQAIVGATGGQIIRADAERAHRSSPEHLDAWGLLHRAYYFWNHAFSPDGLDEGAGPGRRAVELDPRYAAAHAFLGLYLIERVIHVFTPRIEEERAEAEAAAEKAVRAGARRYERARERGPRLVPLLAARASRWAALRRAVRDRALQSGGLGLPRPEPRRGRGRRPGRGGAAHPGPPARHHAGPPLGALLALLQGGRRDPPGPRRRGGGLRAPARSSCSRTSSWRRSCWRTRSARSAAARRHARPGSACGPSTRPSPPRTTRARSACRRVSRSAREPHLARIARGGDLS